MTLDDFKKRVQDSWPQNQAPIVINRASVFRGLTENGYILQAQSSLFDANQVLQLNREDVRRKKDGNIDEFILSVLYWGFPTNRHGIHKNVYSNYNEINDLANIIKNKQSFTEEEYRNQIWPVIQQCHGVNLSFFSKLFYFSGMLINDAPCIILDNRVYKAIRSLTGEDTRQLRTTIQYFRNRPAPYIEYISIIKGLSDHYGLEPERWEYALWQVR